MPTPTPTPTPVPTPVPAVIDRSRKPDPMESFRFPPDAEFLHIWFPHIANADEAVLIYRDEVWLIDCGDERNARDSLKLLKGLGITQIDKLFNTHPHHDHLNGLPFIGDVIPVKELHVCFPLDVNKTMISAVGYAREKHIPVRLFNNGESFSMGDGKVILKFFYNEYDGDPNHMNDDSAQTLLKYGERRMLFCSDMDRRGQSEILDSVSPSNLRADIIRYPHHGKNALVQAFFEAVNPSVAVITNHITDWGSTDFLAWRKVPVFYTSTEKDYVHIYTDGKTWVIEYVPFDSLPGK